MFKIVSGPVRTCITSVLFLDTPDIAAALLVIILWASNETDALFGVVGVVTRFPKRMKQQSAPGTSLVGKIVERFGIPVLCREGWDLKQIFVHFMNMVQYTLSIIFLRFFCLWLNCSHCSSFFFHWKKRNDWTLVYYFLWTLCNI